MATRPRLASLLPWLAIAILACGGGGGGGPSAPAGGMTGSWQATHVLLAVGFPLATCSGPMTVTNATSTTFSGTFSIEEGEDCVGTADFMFSGTRAGNQATLTVVGELLQDLLEVCMITAGDNFWVGTASDTSIDVARDNTLECTDPESGEVVIVEIRWELTAQKIG